MELEELQKAWKELNERVSQNELVHQQQIIEMLSRQKESCLQRMLRMDKIASIFMLGEIGRASCRERVYVLV